MGMLGGAGRFAGGTGGGGLDAAARSEGGGGRLGGAGLLGGGGLEKESGLVGGAGLCGTAGAAGLAAGSREGFGGGMASRTFAKSLLANGSNPIGGRGSTTFVAGRFGGGGGAIPFCGVVVIVLSGCTLVMGGGCMPLVVA